EGGRALSRAGAPADDDDVAGHGVLELHPCLRASTGQVDAVCALGHHTFESELPAGVHGVVDVPVEGLRDMDALTFGYVVPQPLPSIGIGHAQKRVVSCLEQVEDHEEHRCPATLALDVACPAQPHAMLETPEVGATAGADRDELAVEDAVDIDADRQIC